MRTPHRAGSLPPSATEREARRQTLVEIDGQARAVGVAYMPPSALPGALYGLPDPPSGPTPLPVDPSGNITPLGLHDQFLWRDLIYNARQTGRIFQWYDGTLPPPPGTTQTGSWPC